MNRTIKEATVKRFHYDSHDQLRTHLADFLAAYNFARRLKTLGGLTPYEYICKIWTSEPDRFILDVSGGAKVGHGSGGMSPLRAA
jgi:transposase InsO family protein